MLLDYHMHLAPDESELDEPELTVAHIARYVETARQCGVAEIGFTEHVYRFAAAAPVWDHPFWQENAVVDLEVYVDALAAAQRAGLPVRMGIELDYLDGRMETLAKVLSGVEWDYVLGSVHWMGDLAVDHPDYSIWADLAVEDVWESYFQALGRACATGLYDVMAHPDLAKVFGDRPSERQLARHYEEAAEAFAAADVCVEVSTAGLRKMADELYPAPAFLLACRRAGVPATLGSDAHVPGDVGRDFDRAALALHEAGYRTITQLKGRDRRQVGFG